MIDVAKETPQKRASMRLELAEMWEGVVSQDYGLSKTVTLQVIETALTALDALDRVEGLAAELEASEGPATGVALAFAVEIRNRLKGKK
jgi:hypothetical protein